MKATCSIELPITRSCAIYQNYFQGTLLVKLRVIQMQLFDVVIKSMRTETTFLSTGDNSYSLLLLFPFERASLRIKIRVGTWVPSPSCSHPWEAVTSVIRLQGRRTKSHTEGMQNN